MGRNIGLSAMIAVIFLLRREIVYGETNKDGGHYHHKTRHNHNDGFLIDGYSYNSNIRHWNSAFKVYFSVITLILCIILDNPYVSVSIIVAMGYLSVVKGGLHIHEYLSILSIPITFIILGTFAIAIDFDKQPIGQYNLNLGIFYAFTSQIKLKEMVFLNLKVFAAVSAMQMMTLSTPSSEIICVLRKAHIPKLIVELMNIIYRYIFILIDVYNKMKKSAESRQGYCDFKNSCYTFGSIASNLLVISLKKSGTYYDAMESRCFDGDLIFLEEDKKIEKMQIAVAMIFIVYLILLWVVTR
nr:cobalt ECF transporter T component CbiQ [Sedimentibacter sp.]